MKTSPLENEKIFNKNFPQKKGPSGVKRPHFDEMTAITQDCPKIQNFEVPGVEGFFRVKIFPHIKSLYMIIFFPFQNRGSLSMSRLFLTLRALK